MLLPSLNAGTMYHLHQGNLQEADGQILKVEEQSIYFGGGDWTVGSQTVAIPAVHIFGHLGDAYFAPLVATQVVASRTASSRAIENSSLLDVTSRYLALVGAEGELYAIRKSEEGLMQVVRATAAFAKPVRDASATPTARARRPSCCTRKRCRLRRTWPSPRPNWHARSISIRPCDCGRRPG